jgi:hypothetical protein
LSLSERLDEGMRLAELLGDPRDLVRKADFDAFLKRHGADFAQFSQHASRIDPHTYDVVYLDE